MYFDLGLALDSDDQHVAKEKLAQAARLGYECTAVSHHSETGALLGPDLNNIVPPSLLNETDDQTVQQALGNLQGIVRPPGFVPRQLRQLLRLTLEIKSEDTLRLLYPGHRLRQFYDLIAVKPTSLEMLSKVCRNSLDIDIIVLDMSRRQILRLQRSMVAPALKRGIRFEICYALGVSGSAAERKMFFMNAGAYCKRLRGNNIILSSGAKTVSSMRGPLDVMYLAICFGLKDRAAQAAISSNCEAALKHAIKAKSRKQGIDIQILPADVEPMEEVAGPDEEAAELVDDSAERVRDVALPAEGVAERVKDFAIAEAEASAKGKAGSLAKPIDYEEVDMDLDS